MTFFILLRKDALLVWRNRALLVTLVVYPLLVVGVLGLAFADPEQRIPIAVVDHDAESPPIDVLGAEFSTADIKAELDEFAQLRETDEEEALSLLRNGEVDAVVIFPLAFVSDLVQSLTGPARLTVVLDFSDPVKASIAENNIRGVVQRFNDRVVEEKVQFVGRVLAVAREGGTLPGGETFIGFERARENVRIVRQNNNDTLSAADQARLLETQEFIDQVIAILEQAQTIIESTARPLDLQVDHVESGILTARDIVVPAAMALSVFWTGTLATATLLVYERESQASRRLEVAPVSAFTVVSAKGFLTLLLVAAQTFLILLAAVVGWSVRVDGPGLVALVVLASSVAAVGLGLLVASVTRTTSGATLLAVLVTFPMMFLSGLFYPISFMPESAQAVAKALPLTYSVDGLRGAMLRDFTLGDAWPDLAILLVMGAVFGSLALVLSRRRD